MYKLAAVEASRATCEDTRRANKLLGFIFALAVGVGDGVKLCVKVNVTVADGETEGLVVSLAVLEDVSEGVIVSEGLTVLLYVTLEYVMEAEAVSDVLVEGVRVFVSLVLAVHDGLLLLEDEVVMVSDLLCVNVYVRVADLDVVPVEEGEGDTDWEGDDEVLLEPVRDADELYVSVNVRDADGDIEGVPVMLADSEAVSEGEPVVDGDGVSEYVTVDSVIDSEGELLPVVDGVLDTVGLDVIVYMLLEEKDGDIDQEGDIVTGGVPVTVMLHVTTGVSDSVVVSEELAVSEGEGDSVG
jgi:hypothetical protein